MNKGIRLWEKAKKIIPGGTQLLSKRAEMFLPNQWPSYFQKAKGVYVWDLDGNKYLDMSYMGIGTCVLGYADPDVNLAVKRVIESGSMCTLNSPEEVELAELLLKLHQWADQVRFARTGGEALTIAVRLARAHTGKDKIAFCGYHGWHDWYLSANLANSKNLDGHLLKGLKPLGVPRSLKGTAIPFHYNKLDELRRIRGIGTIVMEPVREHEPEKGFLEEVRSIAHKKGAVLIFDEITSGFRTNVGGIHELYGVLPDIAVYGKAISNGFPMAAVVGRKEVMDAAQNTFVSSTYWTERVGPAAAIATIKKMKKYNIPSHLTSVGSAIKDGWQDLAKKHQLKIQVKGILALPTFSFDCGRESQAFHTLFCQEMLKRGFLTSKGVYVSWSHTKQHVVSYLKNVDEVFGLIREAMRNENVYDLLQGPVSHKGFERLT